MTCCPLCRRRGPADLDGVHALLVLLFILLLGATLYHAGFQAGASNAFAAATNATP